MSPAGHHLDGPAFAKAWAAAWNAHDVEAVLAHFADDVVFTSPIARQLLDGSDGVLRGKAALRDYWTHALGLIPDLRFEVLGVYAGVDVLVINYRNQRGNIVCEVLAFDGPLVVVGHGTYLGADADPAGAEPA
ncbi:nuclear transport factor 2 family protein [Patulibacter minatonensis]|uniref:nuclear transport factor 2 family protein n=1 Tax=Patulibacter minatonensis TaxID=298163 RepID=UPI00047E018C|nr:nuclear transport factor 2 family protein [Patulibacter minatonensis]